MTSAQIPNFVAIDTECTGLSTYRGDRLFAVAAVFPSGRTLYWRDEFSGLRELLADETVDKVFCNAKFDWKMLKAKGWKIRGKIWDVMILSHLLRGRQISPSLAWMGKTYLPLGKQKMVDEIDAWFKANKITKENKGKQFENIPPELLKKYCIRDTVLTAQLFIKLYPMVAKTFPFLLEQEHRLLPIVMRMEDRGMLIDLEEAKKQQYELDAIADHAQQFCAGIMDDDFFNLNSPKQKRDLLLKVGLLHRITKLTKKARQPSTGQEALRDLHHPIASMLCVGSQAAYLCNNFIGQMLDHQVDGVIHPGLNQLGTLSGRFSSSKPNLLNMPGEGGHTTKDEMAEQIDHTGIDLAPHIKRIFKVRPGFTHLHADKKKIEVAMLGHYTNDPILVEILNNPDLDIHAEISRKMFNSEDKSLRVRAKAVVFGYIYGAGDQVIANNIRGSLTEAREYRAVLERLCPGMARWKSELAEQTKARGYIVTAHGRRHYMYEGESYMNVNRMCQGTAADEVKSRLVALGEWLASDYPDCTPLLSIHDDNVAEIPTELLHEVAPKYKEVMEETSMKFNVPLPVSLDTTTTRWSDLSKYELQEV